MKLFAAGLAIGLGVGWLVWHAKPAPPPPPIVANAPAPTAPVIVPPTPAPAEPPTSKAVNPAKHQPTATPTPTTQHEDPNVPRLEAALNEARARIHELEARTESHSAEQAKLTALETDLRAQLQKLTSESDDLRKDLAQRTQRIAELETARQRAVQDSAANQKNHARLRELAADMDDLNRRREAYLNNVLTRYREATDLLRTMSLRLDNPRDAASPLGNDLSRIQQAVQNADEDLRQLRTLNARAAKLQKDLAQASR